MLTKRYLSTVANLEAIMAKVVEGTAPKKFTQAHLKGIGFRSSNDRAVIPLLKDLGFLSPEGAPTARYHAYRDKSRSKEILGEALLDAYPDIFTINENPTHDDRPIIEGKFKSTHNVSDVVAKRQAMTFFALLKLADLEAARRTSPVPSPAEDEGPQQEAADPEHTSSAPPTPPEPSALKLRYNIEVHLPPTKDVEVYNAIFKSLREHLLVD